MDRYICIHGHFYQPPRENPWLESVEIQDGAHPFHDWNEKITAECYAPNAVSRIVGENGKVKKIVNNYSKISLNFGPTLLAWLEKYAADTYTAIIKADFESREIFSGHGSAIAQVYNHIIMPLANARDKKTEIIWGIRDFEKRFSRFPEGMWLAETAVDVETLSLLADHGIRFTILAPHQAKWVRPVGSMGRWLDVGDKIDPTRPYILKLPSGKSINIFFYDGPISRSVAFEKLLYNGEQLAKRLIGGFTDVRSWPQIVNIATDGETYGHHYIYGDMALAYALHYIESQNLAKISIYGEYLEKYPPTHEVEIVENTSWSCLHGIERWRSNCGCNSGGKPGWSQNWRGPLREALDLVRDAIAPEFEKALSQYFFDPWEARDAYIDVILDRSKERMEKFFAQFQTRDLTNEEQIRVLKLMEMQRHSLLMYTSCGWFFDEISGIETVQCMQYAARSVQLADELFQLNLEEKFASALEKAPSNVSVYGNGRTIYNELVKPAVITLPQVAAHFAIDSLFETEGMTTKDTYCYDIAIEDYQIFEAGKSKLAIGHAKVKSNIILESNHFSFEVLHFGHHNVNAGVTLFQGEDDYKKMLAASSKAFLAADFPQVIRLMDKYFESWNFPLKKLFRNEQRSILNMLLGSTLDELTTVFSRLYDNNYPLIRFLIDLHTPLPDTLKAISGFVKNAEFEVQLKEKVLNKEEILGLLEEIRDYGIVLDSAKLSHVLALNLENQMTEFESDPKNVEILKILVDNVGFISQLPLKINLWKIQNKFHNLLKGIYPTRVNIKEKNQKWLELFQKLGEYLSMEMESFSTQTKKS